MSDAITGPHVQREFISCESPGAVRAGAGGRPCQGLYHTAAGARPRIAMIATHYQIDFSEHYLAEHMAARGIGFLGWNTRYRGYEDLFQLDQAVVDIGVGVRWLKEQAGVDQVILLGNSGGGSLMAAYQAQAESNSTPGSEAPYLRPARDAESATGLDAIIPGDAYISLAAHGGRPDVLTAWLDAAVVDEADPTLSDPELDLFNPVNGPPFSPEFIERYRAAQVARNHKITAWAKAELDRIGAAGHYDRHFGVPRTWADPRMVDPTLEPTDRIPGHCYRGPVAAANRGDRGIGAGSTLRNWLHMWSLEESQCRAEMHMEKITVPAFVVNPDGDTGVFPSDAESLYRAIGSADKQRKDLPGDHYFIEPSDARDTVAQVLSDWIAERFPKEEW